MKSNLFPGAHGVRRHPETYVKDESDTRLRGGEGVKGSADPGAVSLQFPMPGTPERVSLDTPGGGERTGQSRSWKATRPRSWGTPRRDPRQ